MRIDTDRGRFVLKVANRAEGPAVIGLQVAALEHLAQVDPDLPVPRVVHSVDGGAVETVELDGIPHAVRVVTYLDGAPLDPPLTAELATAVGAMLARIQRDFVGFFHPEAGRSLLWDTRAAGRLVPWAREIRDPALRALATETLKRFAARVPALARLPAQVIHGDFHAGNILVRDGAVSGIIDFGDLVHAPRVQDLGIAVAYGALGADDPLADGTADRDRLRRAGAAGRGRARRPRRHGRHPPRAERRHLRPPGDEPPRRTPRTSPRTTHR